MTQTFAETIEAIRSENRERNFAMEQRKRIDLTLGAYLRTLLGWNPKLKKAESDKIKKYAKDLVLCGEKRAKKKPHELAESVDYKRFESVITASLLSRLPWNSIEDDRTKAMEKLAETLPVWNAFGKGIRGFGVRSLAVIVGEAGDLSNYANKGKLWKRMGLAVMGPGDGLNDVRQGGLKKGKARSEDWIAHGYNPTRRARMYVIGDSLLKQGTYYKKIYDDRKTYEQKRAVDNGLTIAPAAKIPKEKASEYISEGIIHLRSQRYMEKRLLKDLWQAWKKAAQSVPIAATQLLPSSIPITSAKKKELEEV